MRQKSSSLHFHTSRSKQFIPQAKLSDACFNPPPDGGFMSLFIFDVLAVGEKR
jgi:hypothetical protein